MWCLDQIDHTIYCILSCNTDACLQSGYVKLTWRIKRSLTRLRRYDIEEVPHYRSETPLLINFTVQMYPLFYLRLGCRAIFSGYNKPFKLTLGRSQVQRRHEWDRIHKENQVRRLHLRLCRTVYHKWHSSAALKAFMLRLNSIKSCVGRAIEEGYVYNFSFWKCLLPNLYHTESACLHSVSCNLPL